ncbi:MAG TPA: phosphodiester glycosidase family protein, partial [Niabella sp.]|nr:phosphodiester glycosidase family protein [Niabella sp.]
KTGVNFYDFVRYFQQLGCKNALYLDGAVSRMYLPEKYRMDYDGNFGVIIGVTKRKLAGR